MQHNGNAQLEVKTNTRHESPIIQAIKRLQTCVLDRAATGVGFEANYRGADKSLARPGRKEPRKHVRDALDFNNMEPRTVIKFFFLPRKAPKEIHAIMTEILSCFLPGRTKDLLAPL